MGIRNPYYSFFADPGVQSVIVCASLVAALIAIIFF